MYPFYAISDELSAAGEYQKRRFEHEQQPPAIGAKNLKKCQRAMYDKPAALTIYCDCLNINFWRSLQDMHEKFTSPMQKEHATPHRRSTPRPPRSSPPPLSLFGELFDTDAVPAPV